MHVRLILLFLFASIYAGNTQTQSDWELIENLPVDGIENLIRYDDKLFWTKEDRIIYFDLVEQEWHEYHPPSISFVRFSQGDRTRHLIFRAYLEPFQGPTFPPYRPIKFDPRTDSFSIFPTVTPEPIPVPPPVIPTIEAVNDHRRLSSSSPVLLTSLRRKVVIPFNCVDCSVDLITRELDGDTVCVVPIGSGDDYNNMPRVLDDGKGYIYVDAFTPGATSGYYDPEQCTIIPDTLPTVPDRSYHYRLASHGDYQILTGTGLQNNPDTLWRRTLGGPWIGYPLPKKDYRLKTDHTSFELDGMLYLAHRDGLFSIPFASPSNAQTLFSPSDNAAIVGVFSYRQEIFVLTENRLYSSTDHGLSFQEISGFPFRGVPETLEIFGDRILLTKRYLHEGVVMTDYLQPDRLNIPLLKHAIVLRGHSRYPIIHDYDSDPSRYIYHVETDTMVALPNFSGHSLTYDEDRIYFYQSAFYDHVLYTDDGGLTIDTLSVSIAGNERFWYRGDTIVGTRELFNAYLLLRSTDFGQSFTVDTLPITTDNPIIDLTISGEGIVRVVAEKSFFSDDYGQTFSIPPTDPVVNLHDGYVDPDKPSAKVPFVAHNLVLLHSDQVLKVSTDFGLSFDELPNPFEHTRTVTTTDGESISFTANQAKKYMIYGAYLYASDFENVFARIPLTTLGYDPELPTRVMVEGYLFEDSNENCIFENDEEGLNELPVLIGSDTLTTDDDGYFRVFTYPGPNFLTVPQQPEDYELSCNTPHNSLDFTLGETYTYNFPYFLEGFSPAPVANSKEPIAVFPNPVTDILHLPSAVAEETIELYDFYGRLRLSSPFRHRLDVRHLPRGIYWLCVGDESPVRIVLEK